MAAWVRVQGLDRKLNSLFMSDGFEPGTVHWLIRNDGALGLTVIGHDTNQYQICASKPVLTLDQFGIWLHLTVVLDGPGKRVVQYVNGLPVSEKALKVNPPFRIGAAELGNWNANGFLKDDRPRELDGYTWWYLVAPYDEARAGWAASDFLTYIPAP
jgi:hypothetical protein